MADLAAIFKAYDIRGEVGSELTEELTETIGQVFADWLPTKGAVAVGRDMRPDSAALAQALIKGLTSQGREVWDLGEVTSDMSYFAVGKYHLAGSAMITASHNAGNMNGIKFYRDQVIPVGLDSGLADIRDRVLGNDTLPAVQSGTVVQKDITEAWIEHCLSFVAEDFKPYKIAIDTGNGMAGKIITELEPYVPFDITELFFELDGTFPNHEANPMKPETLQELVKTIKHKRLDFGLAFDADGDRAALVDDKGRPVSGSDMITLVARYFLDKYPGSEVIHEVRTTRATKELVASWGGKPYRTKAGRVNIGAIMREREAPFGGETTGHLFFKNNYYADSGLIGALMAIAALQASGRKLSELIDEYHLYATVPEANFEVADKPAVFDRVAAAYQDGQQDRLDGLTVEYPDWWFNLRASNTEPLMRLNLEAKDRALLRQQLDRLTALIKP